MVNQEILGGLKLSLSKGSSLKDAMMSFYNSGYEKQEIEQAARELQQQKIQAKKQMPVTQKVSNYGKPINKKPIIQQIKKIPDKKIQEPIQKEILNKKPLIQKVSSYGVEKQNKLTPKKTIQKVSNYNSEKPKNKKTKFIIFTLIAILLLLITVLGGIFLFKDKVIEFLNNLFKNAWNLFSFRRFLFNV